MPRVNAAPRIIIARTDVVGDNVVSLPVAADLKAALPGCRIGWIAKASVAPLIRLDRNVDEVIEWNEFTSAQPLLPRLQGAWDAAVVLHPKPKRWSTLASVLRQARIPIRVGSGRRWWGLLLYTHWVWQSRHTAGMHEAVRNRHHGRILLRALGADQSVLQQPARTGLTIPDALLTAQRAWLGPIAGRFVVLHVGSNGSSVDWPLRNMAELADRLADRDIPCLISTGFRRPDLETQMRSLSRCEHRYTDPELPLPDLCALIQLSSCVVANSTGMLHVAGGLGVRSVGLFPNMKDCFPEQWGPIGDLSINLVAPPPPGGTYPKRGMASPDHMAGIPVEQVEAAVLRQVAG
jgi:ADP-heptose:LPS heptosyltransferase